MLILVLIGGFNQYMQHVVFSFGICSNGQNHRSSDSHHPIKSFPPNKIFYSPYPLTLFKNPG